MSSKPTHIFESGLGGDWADEEPTTQAQGAKKVWGAPPKKEEAAPTVDFKTLQQQERKEKPAPKPQVYQRPQREESDTYQRPSQREDYGPPQRDSYQRRDYNSGPRDDYGPPRDYQRRDYNSGPRDDYGPPRDYGRRDDSYGGRDYQDRQDRPPREELPIPDHPPFIARLGNLDYDMTDDFFSEFFQDLGILSATIIRDPKTGRSRGFGFVEFESREGLENAMSCNGSEDLFMGRPFQVSVHAGKKEQARFGFGPKDGEEPKSFRRDPNKPFEPAGSSYYGRDNERSYGNRSDFGRGFGREERSYGSDRPSGPPSLNLKPRSEAAAAPRDPSPKKPSKLSEDPFGGVSAPDEDKIKRLAEEREQRAREKEENRKQEMEKLKAAQEKERQDRLAKIEAEKKQREEKQNASWKSEDKSPASAAGKWGKSNTGNTGSSWGDKKADTTWGPKGGAAPESKSWGDKKAEGQTENGEVRAQGIGRGGRGYTPKDNNEGGRGRGDRKPGQGGRGRGGEGPKTGAPKNSPKKNQQTPAGEEGSDSFQTPSKQAPASYKAALGNGPTTTDKKAAENPFAALQGDAQQED